MSKFTKINTNIHRTNVTFQPNEKVTTIHIHNDEDRSELFTNIKNNVGDYSHTHGMPKVITFDNSELKPIDYYHFFCNNSKSIIDFFTTTASKVLNKQFYFDVTSTLLDNLNSFGYLFYSDVDGDKRCYTTCDKNERDLLAMLYTLISNCFSKVVLINDFGYGLTKDKQRELLEYITEFCQYQPQQVIITMKDNINIRNNNISTYDIIDIVDVNQFRKNIMTRFIM